ncbi:MAG: nucleotidyltransferase domain-containing protein [Chloroflexota bacterium]|nr:nucleotidyltransferase domain-containing protein [Chloroflexota bacterium]
MSDMQEKTVPTLHGLRARRDEIIALAHAHGASNVRVFGSVARGDSTAESDIDLLVTWDYARISSWGGVEFDRALHTMLGVRVDVISDDGLSHVMTHHILGEAVPL